MKLTPVDKTIVSSCPVRIIAHRGISVYKKVENTKGALTDALNLGFDIETDVQKTKDDKLVLYHDDVVPGQANYSMGGGGFYLPSTKKPVTECTLDELLNAGFDQAKLETHLSIQAGEGIHLQLNGLPKIATPDDILPLPDGRIVYLEIKRPSETAAISDGLESILLDWINRNKLREKVVIISFNIPSLMKVRQLDSQVAIGVDVHGSIADDPHEAEKLLNLIGIKSWHPPLKQTTKKLIEAIHNLGLEISPWIWDEGKKKEIDEIERLINEGVSGVITNQAQEIRNMLLTASH